MKFSYLFIYCVIFLGISFSSCAELLPDVKRSLSVRLPDNLDQNAFVGLYAIVTPIDQDPLVVGEKFIIKTVNAYNLAVAKRDINLFNRSEAFLSGFNQDQLLEFDYEYYVFPCESFVEQNCIDKIMAEALTTKPFIEQSLLLKRYKGYLKLPFYGSVDDLVVGVSGSNYIRLLHLHLKELVYQVMDNRVDEGLDGLRAEVDFAKKALTQNKTITTIDYVIFVIGLKRTYYLVEQLLDRPEFASQFSNPKLIRLLDSLTKAQQLAFSQVLINYRDQSLRVLYMSNDSWKNRVLNKVSKVEGVGLIIQDDAFSKEETLNLLYTSINEYIKRVKPALPEASMYYQTAFNEPSLRLNALKTEYGVHNIGGRYYVGLEVEGLSKLVLYQYDLISYLRLVQVKLKAKQANINKEHIESFLKSLGDKAQNPYTKEPIVWNKKEETLSYRGVDMRSNKGDESNKVFLKFSE